MDSWVRRDYTRVSESANDVFVIGSVRQKISFSESANHLFVIGSVRQKVSFSEVVLRFYSA